VEYTWVLRVRTDVWWHHTLDSKLNLPSNRYAAVRASHKRVVISGRPTAASDWFLFIAGVHIESFLSLPNSPCEWAVTDSRDMFERFIEKNRFRREPLNERCERGSWPWPVEILRDKSSRPLQNACKHAASVTSGADLCSGLSRGEALSMAALGIHYVPLTRRDDVFSASQPLIPISLGVRIASINSTRPVSPGGDFCDPSTVRSSWRTSTDILR
jgi:hypothetical protein